MNLSIITPVYNEEDKVKDYLERMRKQTVQPEIVIVDGGSTDGTVEIIKEYQKKMPNLKLYFEIGKYRSPANARNIGVKKAKGEIVFIADVDIVFEKDFAKKIVKEFEKHKGFKIIRFKFKPFLIKEFKSMIQKAYYWRDTSRAIRKEGNGNYIFKREIQPMQDSSLGYGEDKLIQKRIRELIRGYGFFESKTELKESVYGPSNLKEVWKRYKWYGRTGMLYYKKSHDKIHLLKMILAVLSIPFFPLMIIPMIRGLAYAVKVFKKYPQGVLIIPLLEAIAFPAMAVGFWEYVLGKSKEHRGH